MDMSVHEAGTEIFPGQVYFRFSGVTAQSDDHPVLDIFVDCCLGDELLEMDLWHLLLTSDIDMCRFIYEFVHLLSGLFTYNYV